jgi:hypothetical protein
MAVLARAPVTTRALLLAGRVPGSPDKTLNAWPTIWFAAIVLAATEAGKA